MAPMKFINLITFFAFQLGTIIGLMAQIEPDSTSALNAQEQSIVTISAFTAQDDLESLKKALDSGLDAGLTINETKEVLVHLYAYCGFPRSIRGLQTL